MRKSQLISEVVFLFFLVSFIHFVLFYTHIYLEVSVVYAYISSNSFERKLGNPRRGVRPLFSFFFLIFHFSLSYLTSESYPFSIFLRVHGDWPKLCLCQCQAVAGSPCLLEGCGFLCSEAFTSVKGRGGNVARHLSNNSFELEIQ